MNLIQKLKTGIIGCGLIGASYFNNVKAQENYIPKYNTTTHYIIKEIQKEGPYINSKNLDNLIYQSKIIIKKNYNKNPYDTEQAKQLMEKIGVLIEKNPELKEDHPCYKKSLVYLAVAEVNKLPLYPVMIPTHMFIRWDPDGMHKQLFLSDKEIPGDAEEYLSKEENPASNKGDFNWDPNFLKCFKDYEYQDFFSCDGSKFGYTEIKEGIYLKNLNKKELLSFVYTEESIHSSAKRDYNGALISINKALELNQKNITAYYSKGKILYSMGKDNCKENCEKYFEESIENFKKAQELTHSWSSFQPEYFNGIAWSLKSLEKYEEAEKNFNEAINHVFTYEDENNEEKKEVLLERLRFYLLTNQDGKAKKDFIQFASLNEFKITEHNGKTLYISPNELRGQLNTGQYFEKKCEDLKMLDTLSGKWRLPTIEELESIRKTNLPGFWFGNLLWSSTKDSLSEKKRLVKEMETGQIYKVNKNLDYHLLKLEKMPINSVCVKTIEEWNINELLSRQKKILLESNYPKTLY